MHTRLGKPHSSPDPPALTLTAASTRHMGCNLHVLFQWLVQIPALASLCWSPLFPTSGLGIPTAPAPVAGSYHLDFSLRESFTAAYSFLMKEMEGQVNSDETQGNGMNLMGKVQAGY